MVTSMGELSDRIGNSSVKEDEHKTAMLGPDFFLLAGGLLVVTRFQCLTKGQLLTFTSR
jgi:hypothetical protein